MVAQSTIPGLHSSKDGADSKPTDFEDALDATGNGLYTWGLLVSCSIMTMAMGVDLFGFSIIVTAAACDLELTISQRGILTSLPFIGIILVSYFWGYMSDTRGRRLVLAWSMGVSYVLSSLCCLAPNWIVMAVIKFIAVCFSCAANSVTYTLLGESCPRLVRNRNMLLMTCCLIFSHGGSALLAYPTLKLEFAVPIAWLGIVFRPWRLLCIILALPCGVGAASIFFIHESPKFLANLGRTDEALNVLKSMYATNKATEPSTFPVTSLKLEEQNFNPKLAKMSLLRSVWEQSAPLFRRPLLWCTIRLYYIISVVYVTNNSFIVWLPYIMNQLLKTMEQGEVTNGSLCDLISSKSTNATESSTTCNDKMADTSIWTVVLTGLVFTTFSIVISYLSKRRKAVLVTILSASTLSGLCINLVPDPISSVILFLIFICTGVSCGIIASYFVDLYPTSCRGMVACLGVMAARTSSFIGINIVGNVLFNHCNLSFYTWSVLVFSSLVTSLFLPPDKAPQNNNANSTNDDIKA